MIRTLYITILSYFLVGGILFHIIGKKLTKEKARHNRIKFIVYFFIINGLFLSIVIKPLVFRILSGVIVVLGLYELLKLYLASDRKKKGFFLFSLLLYLLLSVGFLYFSTLNKNWILFTFMILSVLDSFSQIFGQLFGKHQIAKKISPGKTAEGLAGGTLTALLTAVLIRKLIHFEITTILLLAAGVVLWAFLGDLAASAYKRKYQVKDFSKLIPGHGGILDRFDSLIAAGAWMGLIGYLILIAT